MNAKFQLSKMNKFWKSAAQHCTYRKKKKKKNPGPCAQAGKEGGASG